jgi:hypothetical protein
MNYDYTGVTEVRHDRAAKRLELVVKGQRVTVDGVDRLYVKSAPWTDPDGTVHLNRGRVSLGKDGSAVAGD